MIRYSFILILLVLLAGCKNTPRDAAEDYCHCLERHFNQKQNKTSLDTNQAFMECDAEIKMRYDALSTVSMEKGSSPFKWNKAAKFKSEFIKFRLLTCCNFSGHCDGLSIYFPDSLFKAFPNYLIHENIQPENFSDLIFSLCKNRDIEYQPNYEVLQNAKLTTFNENGVGNTGFYYEVVCFKNTSDLDSLVYLLDGKGCQEKMAKRIMAYKSINKRCIFLCYYDKFDFDKMKRIINNSFKGAPMSLTSTGL